MRAHTQRHLATVFLRQVPKSRPTQTCHIKAAGLRCQVVISCLSAMESRANNEEVPASDTKWRETEERCNCCLTGMQLLSDCMPSKMATDHTGTKISSNRKKHVTSKQPAYDAKWLSDAGTKIASNTNMSHQSHQSSRLTMPSGHVLFECDAIISCLSAMQSRAMSCHITSPHGVLKLSDVMWCLLAPSGGVIAVWLHVFEMWCDVWWLWCHCCLAEMATDDADTKIASIQTETCHSVCKSASATADKAQCHACHACHAKWRWMSAPPEPAQCHACHACHAKWRWMSPSATPATQSAATCLQVLCVPLKVQLHVAKCHACHAKRRGATAPHLKPSAPPEPPQCHKCHACHAKCSYMSPSAVPATQSSYMSSSATPATQNAAAPRRHT